jgi:gamma-glutamylcyclotransferase (GGCT)/AIG2-like uncharacterized protein YtfP
MNALFVYGTLRPGHSNAHILENIGGEWLAGFVSGTFYERGWGAAADFPGIVLHPDGPRVEGYLFISDNLSAHWQMLDEFEDGYDRVEVTVTTLKASRFKPGFISYSRVLSHKKGSLSPESLFHIRCDYSLFASPFLISPITFSF